MSENSTCSSCRKPLKPGATLECGLCHDPICKACDQFLDAGSFAFLRSLPDELSHTHYCVTCHSTKVEPALESYNEMMERAREVFIFFGTQKKAPPVVKKAKERLSVEDCPDRDETILRLAFHAAELGFNGLVDVEVASRKVRHAGWQKSAWQGSGVPAQIDESRLH